MVGITLRRDIKIIIIIIIDRRTGYNSNYVASRTDYILW